MLVHVGAPKTGTSFVQDLLFSNREALAAQGILYPADRFDAHFLAALDLMELQWGGLEKQAVGAWDRLAEQVRDWDGTVIISHEILATASPEQVRRAIESFGDAEVHVLLSARDLVRQIPAEWQENVKHRRVVGYRDFLDKITDPARRGAAGVLVLGRAGGARHPRALGLDPAAGAGARGHGPAARRAPRPALGALRGGVRGRPGGVHRLHRAARTRRWASPRPR